LKSVLFDLLIFVISHTELVQTLLEAGSDPSLADATLQTPLHYALQGQHLSCVALLLRAGANMRASDANGRTPLHVGM
jgi:ankyrin repeat protein